MNKKQLNLLIVLVLLIGGLGLFMSSRRSARWQAEEPALGQNLIPQFPINDVAQITIQAATTNLTLAKVDDTWRVKERWDYPANFAEISGLLRKMWDLKVVQTVKVGPSQMGRLELLPPGEGTNSATRVEFKNKEGKPIQTVLLGKKYMRESDATSGFGGGDWPVGRYVKVQNASESVAVISDPLTDVEPQPDRWLNKDFFKVEKLRSISVTSTNATNSWKLVRDAEGGDLKLADKQEGEEFDSTKASSVGYALSSPSFNDLISPETKPDEAGMDQPLTATLETFDNFTYTVHIGKKTDDDNYHLKVAVKADINKERVPGKDEKPEDKEKLDKEFQDKVKKLEDKLKQEQAYEKWTYLVAKWTVDPLLKERKEFLAEKKDPSAEAPKPETSTSTTPETPSPLSFDPLKVDVQNPPAPPVPVPPAEEPKKDEIKIEPQ